MPTLARIWDLLFFVVLFPIVLLMGSQLPGDWINHRVPRCPALRPSRRWSRYGAATSSR